MLFFKYIKINLIATMEYKLAFSMTTIGRILTVFLEVIALFFMFDRFNTLLSYTLSEVAICYLVIRLSYSISRCFGRGFDAFYKIIKNGMFDSLMIRPRSLILQVFGSQFDPNDIGTIIQYIIMLLIFLKRLTITWNIFKLITILLMVISGVSIFLGIFIISSAICFYSIQGLEFINIFTNGGVEMAGYPLTIYNKWVTRFFTFIIPFGCANYLPLLYLTDRVNSNIIFYILSPIYGILFIAPCIYIWLRASKAYSSTGS